MENQKTRADMTTMTEPRASERTWRKTPRMFIWVLELGLAPCEWPWPWWTLFSLGGGDGNVSSFSLSSVTASWWRRLRECDRRPCECPCELPCSGRFRERIWNNSPKSEASNEILTEDRRSILLILFYKHFSI